MNYEAYIKEGRARQIKKVLPRRILENFEWKKILSQFGHISMDIKKYEVNDNPDLYAKEVEQLTLKEFYEQDKRQWAIKHSFDRSTVNPFLSYLIHHIEEKIPLHFNDKYKYTLRISPREWAFPKHFDGVENFMILLNGRRNVDISYKHMETSYQLRAGDFFYIPPLWEHYFTASNPEPPIVLNMMIKSRMSDAAFKEAYPDRVAEIEKRM